MCEDWVLCVFDCRGSDFSIFAWHDLGASATDSERSVAWQIFCQNLDFCQPFGFECDICMTFGWSFSVLLCHFFRVIQPVQLRPSVVPSRSWLIFSYFVGHVKSLGIRALKNKGMILKPARHKNRAQFDPSWTGLCFGTKKAAIPSPKRDGVIFHNGGRGEGQTEQTKEGVGFAVLENGSGM